MNEFNERFIPLGSSTLKSFTPHNLNRPKHIHIDWWETGPSRGPSLDVSDWPTRCLYHPSHWHSLLMIQLRGISPPSQPLIGLLQSPGHHILPIGEIAPSSHLTPSSTSWYKLPITSLSNLDTLWFIIYQSIKNNHMPLI